MLIKKLKKLFRIKKLKINNNKNKQKVDIHKEPYVAKVNKILQMNKNMKI